MTQNSGAYLYQINVSNGGVPKRRIDKAYVSVDGVAGDKQGNRTVHGGIDRALCLYSLEQLNELRNEGHTIGPGSSGENFTISGFDWACLQLGDRLRIGESLHIEITSYAEPCRHNARWFQNRDYKRISQKIHPGWSRLYAKVLTEGPVQSGNSVFVEIKTGMEQQA